MIKPNILIKLQKKFENIIILLRKRQGLSFARNLSFEVCKGTFLAFMMMMQ